MLIFRLVIAVFVGFYFAYLFTSFIQLSKNLFTWLDLLAAPQYL